MYLHHEITMYNVFWTLSDTGWPSIVRLDKKKFNFVPNYLGYPVLYIDVRIKRNDALTKVAKSS